MKPEILLATFKESWFFSQANLKSPDRLELMALMREVAVEMIAARTAHPTRAVSQGVVVFAIIVMSTLPPKGTSRFVAFARQPKNTGTMHTIIVQTPARKEALETIFGEPPAKQRCPISCPINTKKRGMSSQPLSFGEMFAKSIS